MKAEPEDRPPSKRKPNRKRWCRGKPGVEHKPVCVVYSEHKQSRIFGALDKWRLLVCSDCGKHLDLYHPPFIPDPNHKPPEWVDK